MAKRRIDIGSKIRRIRREKNLTLQDVARSSGLSISLLSEIERNNKAPSISTLLKIAEVLETRAYLLLDEGIREDISIVRADGRKSISSNMPKVTYEALNGKIMGGTLQVLLVKADSDEYLSIDTLHHHIGEECGFVVKGKIEATVEGETYLLGEGDSIYFHSRLPHLFRNADKEESRMIWVLSPPSFM
jgi:transcriptional regulator with XRE-family HTH domain